MSIDDSLLHQRMRRSSLLEEIDATPDTSVSTAPSQEDAVPDLDELTPLPRAGDPYKAFSRPERKAVPTLRLLAGNPRSRGLCYADLHNIDMVEEDGSAIIVLGFSGLIPARVTIEGRNLEKLHDLLAYHRVSWIRQIPSRRDFREDREAVVVRIAVEALER